MNHEDELRTLLRHSEAQLSNCLDVLFSLVRAYDKASRPDSLAFYLVDEAVEDARSVLKELL